MAIRASMVPASWASPSPGHLLPGEPRPPLAEVGARVAQREPVDVEDRDAEAAPLLDDQLHEQLLAGQVVGRAVEPHPVAGPLAVEAQPEVAVAEPRQVPEDPVAVQRHLHPLRRVEAEQQPLPGGPQAERLLDVGHREVAGVAELGLAQVLGDAAEAGRERLSSRRGWA